MRHLTTPTLPRFNESRTLESLRTAFVTNPEDFSTGMRLYSAETETGNDDVAIITLEKIVQLPDCPDYAFYLLAKAHERRREFEASWRSLEKFITKKPPR